MNPVRNSNVPGPLGGAILLSLVALGAACSPPQRNFPITQIGHGTAANNARLVGTAPDVARTVNGDRIARAEGEPQN